MLYPVYVHPGDAKHAHGVTFPDFPGCFSAADKWSDLPAAVQEAVEAHFNGEPDAVPPNTAGKFSEPTRVRGWRLDVG